MVGVWLVSLDILCFHLTIMWTCLNIAIPCLQYLLLFSGVDVYFSPHEDTFTVLVEPFTGIHQINIDETKYTSFTSKNDRKRRNLVYALDTNSSTDGNNMYKIEERKANKLNTFIKVLYRNTFLIVRDVRFRLVITLPLDVHHLKESRFYIILYSKGDGHMNETFGNLHFRQDQPHIDLFVFFSVFFSCFFLFLAMCVLLWKVKQAFDIRRNRQQRAREMETMASRPFAKVLSLIDVEPYPPQCSPPLPKKGRLHRLTSRHFLLPDSPSGTLQNPDDHFSIVPIAIEPTDDGIAAVATIVIQLPGGTVSPVKLCLGSALSMRVFPHSGPKTSNRRRVSSSNA